MPYNTSVMQIDKERFASPLNYNPRMAHYWSVHERDQVFGAKWDTYKYQWTRSSVHNPEDEDLNQDIGTAVAAARYTDEPVFGVHILPARSDTNRTAYLQWLKVYPGNCKHIFDSKNPRHGSRGKYTPGALDGMSISLSPEARLALPNSSPTGTHRTWTMCTTHCRRQ